MTEPTRAQLEAEARDLAARLRLAEDELDACRRHLTAYREDEADSVRLYVWQRLPWLGYVS